MALFEAINLSLQFLDGSIFLRHFRLFLCDLRDHFLVYVILILNFRLQLINLLVVFSSHSLNILLILLLIFILLTLLLQLSLQVVDLLDKLPEDLIFTFLVLALQSLDFRVLIFDIRVQGFDLLSELLGLGLVLIACLDEVLTAPVEVLSHVLQLLLQPRFLLHGPLFEVGELLLQSGFDLLLLCLDLGSLLLNLQQLQLVHLESIRLSLLGLICFFPLLREI